jgi:hypothetical protein
MAPHVPVAALEQAERIFAGEYASVIARPAGSAAPFVVSAPTMTPTNALHFRACSRGKLARSTD